MKAITVKLDKHVMIGKLDSDDEIERNFIDSSRWSLHYEFIFKHEGKFYRAYYSVGATEYQDETPWQYDKEVECEEVVQTEKMVKVWVPVGEVMGLEQAEKPS